MLPPDSERLARVLGALTALIGLAWLIPVLFAVVAVELLLILELLVAAIAPRVFGHDGPPE